MIRCPHQLRHLWQLVSTLLLLLADTTHFLQLCARSRAALAAENLFLRKQLALYQERHVTPRRASNTTRASLVWLARWFEWRQVLAVVQPAPARAPRRKTPLPAKPPAPLQRPSRPPAAPQNPPPSLPRLARPLVGMAAVFGCGAPRPLHPLAS